MSLRADCFTSFDLLTASQFNQSPSVATLGEVNREPRFYGTIASVQKGWRGTGQSVRGPNFSRIIGPTQDTFGVAFHFRVSDVSGWQGLCWIGDGGPEWAGTLFIFPGGKIGVEGSAAWRAKNAKVTVNTWHTIEWLVHMHDKGAFTVLFDGVADPKLNRVNVKTDRESHPFDRVRFYNPNMDLDDLVIRIGQHGFDNGAASEAISDQWGSPVVATIRANRDGAASAWSTVPPTAATHAETVDDLVAADSPADYVEATVEGSEEFFHLGPLPADTKLVKAITTLALVSKGSTGRTNIRHRLRLGRNAYNHPKVVDDVAGNPNWAYDVRLWNTVPSGLVNMTWSLADASAFQLGFAATEIDPSSAAASSASVRIAQVAAEALITVQPQLALPVIEEPPVSESRTATDPSSPVPRSLQSLQVDRLHHLASLWRVERQDGTVLRFTDHSTPLVLPAGALEDDEVTYTPLGGVSAAAREQQAGLKVSNTEVVGILSDDAITNEDLRKGLYRDAEIREFLVDWRVPWAGAFIDQFFWITETTFDGLRWTANLAGNSRWLKEVVGRTLTKRCQWTLGDSRCKFDLSPTPFTVPCTVTEIVPGNPRKTFYVDAFTQGGSNIRNFYKVGFVTWTSGANAGLPAFEVQASEHREESPFDDRLWLFVKTPADIEVGDTLTLVAGCQKNFTSDCVGKFNNGPNFGGFPDIPGPDKILTTPAPKVPQA